MGKSGERRRKAFVENPCRRRLGHLKVQREREHVYVTGRGQKDFTDVISGVRLPCWLKFSMTFNFSAEKKLL